jgi:hypothetical protein
MFALPPSLRLDGDPQVSGLACPDCCGVLEVELQGRNGHLGFRCRIEHTYALPDLLLSKEQAVEDRLWRALTAVEELVALLRDLEARAEECWPEGGERCHSRRVALDVYADTLRRVIEEDRPLSLDPGGSEGAP